MTLRNYILVSFMTAALGAAAINVDTTPGHLQQSLKSTDPSTITTLTVTGSINAVDLQYIADNLRNLKSLDLSDVTIAPYKGDHLINGSSEANANEIPPYSLSGLTAESLTLPRSVTKIGEGALLSSNIKSLEIPANVTSVDLGALADCRNLKEIIIPAGVSELGSHTLSSLPNITTVTINAQVTTIPASAFAHNTKLTKVVLPSTVTKIDSAAFAGCSSLATINLPTALTAIGDKAFQGTTLEQVELAQLTKLRTIGAWAFANNDALTSVSLPEGLLSIGEGAFFGDKLLNNLSLPQGVTEVPAYAFTGNTAMNVTSLGNSHITSIGNLALKGWSSTTFELPSHLEYLGDYAMEDWNNVTKMTMMSEQVPALGTDVWANVDQPKVNLDVPDTLETQFKAAPQWKEFNITGVTGVEDVIADATSQAKTIGYFRGTDLVVESSGDMKLVEVYNTTGAKLVMVEAPGTSVNIDTEGWNTHIYIVRVVNADGSTTSLKLARR